MTPLYLVACVAGKRRGAYPAQDLYTSPWFRMARAYVERRGGEWRILSALHGVVTPDRVIGPYNQALPLMRAAERRQWGARVVADLRATVDPQRPLIVLAGTFYRAPIEAAFGDRVRVPMRGLGIGYQLAFLADDRVRCAPLSAAG